MLHASCARLFDPKQRCFQQLRVALKQYRHKRAGFTQYFTFQLLQGQTPDIQAPHPLNLISRLYGVFKETAADREHLGNIEARVVASQREANTTLAPSSERKSMGRLDIVHVTKADA
jgi:hypothetical protein